MQCEDVKPIMQARQETSQTEVNYQELLRENVTNAGFISHSSGDNSSLNSANTQNESFTHTSNDVTPVLNINIETHGVVETSSQHSHIEPNGETGQTDTPGPQSRCISLIGAILRIMGDEQYSRTCGKHLRVMGDEIYCVYAARKLIPPLLRELNTEETVYY